MKKKLTSLDRHPELMHLDGISDAIVKLGAERRRIYNQNHGLEDSENDIKI